MQVDHEWGRFRQKSVPNLFPEFYWPTRAVWATLPILNCSGLLILRLVLVRIAFAKPRAWKSVIGLTLQNHSLSLLRALFLSNHYLAPIRRPGHGTTATMLHVASQAIPVQLVSIQSDERKEDVSRHLSQSRFRFHLEESVSNSSKPFEADCPPKLIPESGHLHQDSYPSRTHYYKCSSS